MAFKDSSYLELWGYLLLARKSHPGNVGRRHFEQHICEIILNLDQWLRRLWPFEILLI